MALLNNNQQTGPGNQNFGRGFGDIYGPVGQATRYYDQPQNQNPQPQQQEQPAQQSQGGNTRIDVTAPQSQPIEYGRLGPHTREVSEDELVEHRLQGLLASDSPYIQQAVRQGERAAARRGALSSSIFAGNSQAAAIQAALPIAAQDASTYSRVRSENSKAINTNTLAKMQSMTSMGQSQLAASASITSSAIAANANLALGEMRVEAEREARQFNAAHEEAMMNLETELRSGLMQQEFGHDINMADLANEYALDQLGYQGSIEGYLQNRGLQAGFMSNMFGSVFNSINTLNTLEMDEEGFQAAYNNIWNTMGTAFQIYNQFTQGGGFPEIQIPGTEPAGGG